MIGRRRTIVYPRSHRVQSFVRLVLAMSIVMVHPTPACRLGSPLHCRGLSRAAAPAFAWLGHYQRRRLGRPVTTDGKRTSVSQSVDAMNFLLGISVIPVCRSKEGNRWFLPRQQEPSQGKKPGNPERFSIASSKKDSYGTSNLSPRPKRTIPPESESVKEISPDIAPPRKSRS